MRHGFEAVTIKIESTKKAELQRRCLEHPRHGMWDGPKSYADLIRIAIDQFLAPAPAEPSAKKLPAEKKKAPTNGAKRRAMR